jgi:hypothetical protein
VLEGHGVARVASKGANPPFAATAAYVLSALFSARREPIAEASFPVRRARSIAGTAMAAIIPMIAITIRSSVSVNPECPNLVPRLQF